MKPLVLLLVLMIHLGVSVEHSRVVKFKKMKGKEYTLQFCSLAMSNQKPTCIDCNNQDSEDITCQMYNQNDFFCVRGPGDMLPPSLISATNCSATIVSTTTTTAARASSMDYPPMIYTTCTMTYTTTISMAPTSSASKIPAANLHIGQAILGIVVGILGVLLAIVSTGWVCTCWIMQKRRRKMNINTTNIR